MILIAESISHLADNQTVELFYLQARSLIWRGLLEVEADVVFQLAALGLQAAHGDYQVVTRQLKCKIRDIIPEHQKSSRRVFFLRAYHPFLFSWKGFLKIKYFVFD